MIQQWIRAHTWQLLLGGLGIIYLATRLLSLTSLPVFADEAIYIRWAQLIISDPRQYLLFPLNDGKTPLYIWSLVPFLQTVRDPLLAGRLLSIVVGLMQLYVIGALVRVVGGGRRAQAIGMLLVIFLPYWHFHHRMALMDSMLTLWLSISLLALLRVSHHLHARHFAQSVGVNLRRMLSDQALISWVMMAGVSWGLALLTKLPALFFAPVFLLQVLHIDRRKDAVRQILFRTIVFGIAGAIGIGVFLLLRLHPAFGQLFARGGDFTYTVSEIIESRGATVIRNIGWLMSWLGQYVSATVIILTLLAPLVIKKMRSSLIILILSGVVFVSPFILLGQTIYPRYLLPIVIPLTVATAVMIESAWTRSLRRRVLVVLLLLETIIMSGQFFSTAFFNSDQIPFPAVDRMQYLEEWSSGHGIREVVTEIESYADRGRTVVLTEGYFGTLPDALLMYFFTRDVSNVAIHGIGAPVREIPSTLAEELQTADTVLLIVNSHRMQIQSSDRLRFTKVRSYPRPNDAPSLDLYEVVTLYDR